MSILKPINSIIVVLCVLFMNGGFAQAFAEKGEEGKIVQWERIEGLSIGNQPLNIVAGVKSVGFEWSATRGWAQVNLQNGFLKFRVKGLVLSAQPAGGPNPAGLVIGVPSPGATEVKGTIVCNAAESFPYSNVVLVDSEPVSFSPTGDADFRGKIDLPTVCDDMAFLVRVANVGPITDLWIAHGAVRTLKAHHHHEDD